VKNVIEIDGHKAVVAFDPELRMLRGEFLGLKWRRGFRRRRRGGAVP
jgi:predicted HicB family RNase H-like nuclease